MTEPTNPSGAQTEILIVEDSPLEAEMLRRILVRAGYRVMAVAKNGEEGLQALREHPSALVMSDINMPLMNGYELCHAIKLDEKLWHTPVILVTALSEPKDIIKALDVGADGYITKPYIEDILLGRIRSLLANPARRKLADERRRILLEYGGEQHSVAVDSPQMANLLLSVYENSLTLNQELMHIQNQLNVLNDSLDEKVRERTAALRENEEKFRVIFEGGLDGILLADAETRRFAGGNPEICRMLDYSSEEIMQLGVADIHPQQALPHVVEQFEKQLRGEIQLAADIPVKRKDGSVFYADIKSSPVSFGGKNYLLGIFRDITERKQAEAQLKNSEERHRQIVQTSMDGFWIADTKGCILDVNDAYCQMTGYAREELLNMRIPDVEAKETPEVTAQHIREIMTKGYARFETRHRRKDGQLLDIEVSVVHRPDTENGYFFIFLRDITERKQAEDAFRTIVETSAANIGMEFFRETVRSLSAWLGVECVIIGELVDENRVRALAMQLDGQAIAHYEYALPGTPCENATQKGYCEYHEGVVQLFPADHDLIDMRAQAYIGAPISDKNGEVIGILCIISRHRFVPPPMVKEVFEIIAARAGTEIERKHAEDKLQESNERFDLAVKGTNDGIWDWDIRTNANYFSPRFMELLGYGPDEVAQELATFESFLHPEDRAWVFDRVRQHLEDKVPYNVEYRMRTKNGEYRWFQARGEAVRDQSGKPFRMVGSIIDISGRKQAEEELRLRAQLLDSASDTIFVVDFNGNFVYLNEAAWKTRGYTRDEMMSLNLHVLDTPKYEKLIESRMRDLMENGQCIFESEHRRKDGSVMPVEINAHTIESGGRKLVLSVIRDITERKQAEAKILAAEAELQRLLDAANQSRRALLSVIQDQKRTEVAIQHANRALATLSTVNRNLVHATDENELLQAICQAIVKQKGYRLAWVGYVQHDENKSIKIMARAGHDEGYLDTIQLTWAETKCGLGPSGRAIRSGATQLCQDMANDPLYLPWCDAALQHGYAASIALPLTNGNNSKVFGILNVYAAEVNAFTSAEIDLLEETAGDLAFGVRSLHTRQERDLALIKNQEQLVQLQDSLEDTVRAMAAIVEMRDPYTAGHQIRVADLSTEIAKQMALPEEQIHAIHLAGIVHDLGKIRIPAEILSKPGKITDLEFGLIKTHAQAGYDILKDINFPWPIAQMVLQHHERLDGSGYPQGLKGEDILLEARILAVADVVEAMSSHRPYRPGLGIETALAEITKLRGVHFDPQVVDACLCVIRDKGFVFK